MIQETAGTDRTGPGFPEGLRDEHLAEARGFARHANPLSIAILGALVVLAMTGSLGGAPHPVRIAEASATRVEVSAPAVLRNGEFFEIRITVVPHRPIDALAIGVSPSYWRDITINTMFPAPAEESHEAGVFRFDYGGAEAGKPLVVKIDGQINPSLLWGTSGRVLVYDGEAEIASVPVELRVLP